MAVRTFLFVSLVTLLTVAKADRAHADAIDGHWCYTDGRTFSIDGPKLVTPGGQRMEGDYDRHGFAYTVPAGEAGAGSKILMDLIDDDTLHLTDDGGPVQVWIRCARPVS